MPIVVKENRQRLTRDFYRQDTITVAEQLLGCVLVRQHQSGVRLSGIVVEVEAYLSSGDEASHSFRGPGKKNASMFSRYGTLYVYPIHSRHCLNVVTEAQGVGAAVLIRALEPIEGLRVMSENRMLESLEGRSLTSGPGRLCDALDVDRELDGVDLTTSKTIWLEGSGVGLESWNVVKGKRIGITKSKELPLRMFLDGNRFVSGLAREHSSRRNRQFLNNRSS